MIEIPWVGSPVSTGGTEANASSPSRSAAWFDYTYFDRSWTVNNGVYVFKLGLYATSAATFTLKLAELTSAGHFTILVSQSIVHAGGGWQDVTIAPYLIPASGDFHAGTWGGNSTQPSIIPAHPAAYKAGDVGLGAQTFTENDGQTGFPAVRVTY